MLIDTQYTSGIVPRFAGGIGTGLLQTLVEWCTSKKSTPGLDWTIELNQDSTESNGVTKSYDGDFKEVILSNTGLSENETIIIGMREYYYTTTFKFGWNLNGYTTLPNSWNSLASSSHELDGWDSTVHAWSELPTLQLFDSEMAYWFYSTKEFIFVSARVGTCCYQCYLGNLARYSSPLNYPNPLVIAGSSYGTTSYRSGGNGPIRPIENQNYCSLMVVDPEGSWRRYYDNDSPYEYAMYPMHNNSNIERIGLSFSGKALIMPGIIVTDEYTTCGELYNVAAFIRNDSQSEQEYLDEDSNKWRVFVQGKDDEDYMFLCALEEKA